MPVLVVLHEAGKQRIAEIVLNDDSATFAQFAAALGLETGHPWFVDGQPLRPADPVVGLVLHGSVISDEVGDNDDGPGLRLDQIAGPDVGWSGRVRQGPNTLGRSKDVELQVEDASTSGRHCRLDCDKTASVVVTDLGSRNGTRVGGRRVDTAPLEVGDVMWAGSGIYRLSDRSQSRPFLGSAGRGSSRGKVSFNRPPRGQVPASTGPVPIPAPAAAPVSTPIAFSVAAVVAPLIMAAAMVAVLGSPRYALFALLSPVMAVVSWLESRSRSKRETKRFAADRQARIESFELTLTELELAERAVRWQRQPDICTLLSWMHGPGTRLWERRGSDQDSLTVAIAVGDQPWRPVTGSGELDEDLLGLIDRRLLDVPIETSLAGGEVIGLVGDMADVRSVARAIVVSLAATVGPSDLQLVVATERDRIREWGWMAWLPHTGDEGDLGKPWIVDETEALVALSQLLDPSKRVPGRAGVLVVDGVSHTSGRSSIARRLWTDQERPWGGVVVAEREDQLPSECSVVVEVAHEGARSRIRRPGDGTVIENVSTIGLGPNRPVLAARAIARLDDPDLDSDGAYLAPSVSLGELPGFDSIPQLVGTSWERLSKHSNNSLVAAIGQGPDGVFEVDLVNEGPHALVAGTTGSGKSELLRTWIASLAATHRPSSVNFVLIDYKGGSAFDVVSGLPHVVGMVTDLDEHLGRRALTCLRAELKWRERLLRARGADELAALDAGVLPRLVVVIDEFATLAAELPGFLDALVGIAQRGRSLGVHLILATQRPAGAVSDSIRANTNLRIALRVQDSADSTDVVGDPSASLLPRLFPGRACVRLGPGDVTIIQTASATLEPGSLHTAPVEVVGKSVDGSSSSAIDQIVAACAVEFAAIGAPTQRRPWPEPLPDVVSEAMLAVEAEPDGVLVVGIADEPELQRRSVFGWNYGDGNLTIVGLAGSGVEAALRAIAIAAINASSPDRTHLHAIELLGSSLRTLDSVPHVGGIVGVNEPERLTQLVNRHRGELDSRVKEGHEGRPTMFLVIDHLGALLGDNQSSAGMDLVEDLRRVWTDGPSVGIHCVVGADRLGAIPTAWQAAATQSWMFRLADESEYQQAGLARSQIPANVHGRAISANGVVFQVADRGELEQREPTGVPGPLPLLDLSSGVDVKTLPAANLSQTPWSIPVGHEVASGSVAAVRLHAGDNILVAGSPRSGVTNTLAVLASQLEPHIDLVGYARPESALTGVIGASRTATDPADLLAMVSAAGGAVVVMIDEAHKLDDAGLGALFDNDLCTVVAGGRSDQLRRSFGHWSSRVGESRTGLLLKPDVDLDGDLLGLRLGRPSRRDGAGPGRGFLVSDGAAVEVHVAVSGIVD